MTQLDGVLYTLASENKSMLVKLSKFLLLLFILFYFFITMQIRCISCPPPPSQKRPFHQFHSPYPFTSWSFNIHRWIVQGRRDGVVLRGGTWKRRWILAQEDLRGIRSLQWHCQVFARDYCDNQILKEKTRL